MSQSSTKITTLASDLDGTLIPDANCEHQYHAVPKIGRLVREHSLRLVFVTGRSYELTLQAIKAFSLPEPEVILCDVGSRMMRRRSGWDYEHDEGYADLLATRLSGWTHERIQAELLELVPHLMLQSSDAQTRFKCSFEFPEQCFGETRSLVSTWIETQNLPLAFIASVDPFAGKGLLDILPAGVNKGFALKFWAESNAIEMPSIVFCGDSGNDTAAMLSGVRGVVVGNADQQLRHETKRHCQNGAAIHHAKGFGPEGVLEGLFHHLESR